MHVIKSDAEAIEIAARLAESFAPGASERDAQRKLPDAELDQLSASGLLAITGPAAHGGADATAVTVAEVFRLLAAADPNIAQIPQSHFAYVNVLRHNGSEEQRAFFFGEVLSGKRFGNAQSEAGTKHVQDYRTQLSKTDSGGFTLNGVKHYSTGALFADWIPVLARFEEKIWVAYVPRHAPGVTVIDDWAGMGQRITASGTVELTDVRVPADRVVPHHLTFDRPQLYGAFAQLLHAAIDVGIADGAFASSIEFVRTKARPWFEAGVSCANEDPLTIQRVGELAVSLRAARSQLRTAAEAIDSGLIPEASIAVATAKVLADRAAIEVTNALFELGGTRSSLDGLNLHRHWRNARTHTLHDPVRWKVQHIGRHALNGTPPPNHGLL